MLHRVATTGLSLLSLSLGVVLVLASTSVGAPNPTAAENQLKNKQSTIASAEALKANLANLSGAIKAATEAEIAAKCQVTSIFAQLSDTQFRADVVIAGPGGRGAGAAVAPGAGPSERRPYPPAFSCCSR
jgi:hypothetical protein